MFHVLAPNTPKEVNFAQLLGRDAKTLVIENRGTNPVYVYPGALPTSAAQLPETSPPTQNYNATFATALTEFLTWNGYLLPAGERFRREPIVGREITPVLSFLSPLGETVHSIVER